MYFNGTTDFISVPSSAALQLPIFTVSAKFRTTKDYTKSVIDGMIVNKGGTGGEATGGNQNYGIRIFKETNKIRAGFETSTGTDYEPASTVKVNDGKWHHVLCSFDGAKVRLYLDGAQNASMVTNAKPEINTQPLVIGRNSKDSTRWFQGAIEKVYIWNRRLSDAEAIGVNSNIIPRDASLVYENELCGCKSP